MAKKADKIKEEVVEETTKVETAETPTKEVIADVEDTFIADELQDEGTPKPIGNPNPATGEPHDCSIDGRFRSISVGGKRMQECTVCGARS